MKSFLRILIVCSFAALSTGCATVGEPGPHDGTADRIAAMQEQKAREEQRQGREMPRFYFFMYSWTF